MSNVIGYIRIILVASDGNSTQTSGVTEKNVLVCLFENLFRFLLATQQNYVISIQPLFISQIARWQVPLSIFYITFWLQGTFCRGEADLSREFLNVVFSLFWDSDPVLGTEVEVKRLGYESWPCYLLTG